MTLHHHWLPTTSTVIAVLEAGGASVCRITPTFPYTNSAMRITDGMAIPNASTRPLATLSRSPTKGRPGSRRAQASTSQKHAPAKTTVATTSMIHHAVAIWRAGSLWGSSVDCRPQPARASAPPSATRSHRRLALTCSRPPPPRWGSMPETRTRWTVRAQTASARSSPGQLRVRELPGAPIELEVELDGRPGGAADGRGAVPGVHLHALDAGPREDGLQPLRWRRRRAGSEPRQLLAAGEHARPLEHDLARRGGERCERGLAVLSPAGVEPRLDGRPGVRAGGRRGLPAVVAAGG